MGQGTESCGGYEEEYDPYYEELRSSDPRWTTRDGESVPVSKMTTKHLHGARQVALRASSRASFTSDSDTFDGWVELFDREIARRGVVVGRVAAMPIAQAAPKAPAPLRGVKVWMVCHCGVEYQAREADLERGWGLSCSKRCAAIRREFGRPAAKRKKS